MAAEVGGAVTFGLRQPRRVVNVAGRGGGLQSDEERPGAHLVRSEASAPAAAIGVRNMTEPTVDTLSTVKMPEAPPVHPSRIA